MNTIGKILAVFIAVTSIGFLAFAIALRNGGPDWKGEMRSPDLVREFVFTTEAGETPSWSVRHRRTETSIAEKSKIQAEVVLKARKRLEEDLGKRLQELNAQTKPLEDAIQATIDSIAADKKGVEIREQKFNEVLDKAQVNVETVGDELSSLILDTQKILREGQERREEGYRLANQLDLMRNDKFAAVEQRKVLEDELVRLQENKRRLQKRQQQLKGQLGDND